MSNLSVRNSSAHAHINNAHFRFAELARQAASQLVRLVVAILNSQTTALVIVGILCLATVLAITVISLFSPGNTTSITVVIAFSGSVATSLFSLLKTYQTDYRVKEHGQDQRLVWARQKAILDNQAKIVEVLSKGCGVNIEPPKVPPEAEVPPSVPDSDES